MYFLLDVPQVYQVQHIVSFLLQLRLLTLGRVLHNPLLNRVDQLVPLYLLLLEAVPVDAVTP